MIERSVDILIGNTKTVENNVSEEYYLALDAYRDFLVHSTKFIELLKIYERDVKELNELKKEKIKSND